MIQVNKGFIFKFQERGGKKGITINIILETNLTENTRYNMTHDI